MTLRGFLNQSKTNHAQNCHLVRDTHILEFPRTHHIHARQLLILMLFNSLSLLLLQESFFCECCTGFAGQHCEEIDACTPSPCTNNGICVDLSQGHEGNSYQCLCPYGESRLSLPCFGSRVMPMPFMPSSTYPNIIIL
jgi:hypothetical protein